MYINTLDHISVFQDLRRSDQVYVVMKYSPRCPLCLDKMWDLYKWLATSKVENIWLLNTLQYPEIKIEIVASTWLEHHTPQLIVLQDKKIIAHRDENDIDIGELEKKLGEVLIGH